MNETGDFQQRRRILLQALTGGAFALAAGGSRAQLLGKVPRQLPASEPIYEARGEVAINGRALAANTIISANDTITTGKASQLIFVVGKDAFLLREASTLQLSGSDTLVHTLRLITGAVLTVFGKSEHRLTTPTSTLGIRGTGVYVEAQPEQSYVCVCYGTVDIAATGSDQRETINAKHHDTPRYVAAGGAARIAPAPMINHTDEELMLIEALVGRIPPFALFDSNYGRSGAAY